MYCPPSWLVGMTLLTGLVGCQIGDSRHMLADGVIRSSDNLAARASFIKWNMNSRHTDSDCSGRFADAFEIAGLSPFELDNLMCRQPAPSIEQLPGRWLGINKGIGAAVVGVMQDIKVFSVAGGEVKGHNVAVHQVPIADLECRGFEPRVSPWTGCERAMGNFVVVAPCRACEPLRLDYTQAENRITDPSRRLVDELVQINEKLLLGKAFVKLGQNQMIPVAYFVLVRADSTGCDEYQYRLEGNGLANSPAH